MDARPPDERLAELMEAGRRFRRAKQEVDAAYSMPSGGSKLILWTKRVSAANSHYWKCKERLWQLILTTFALENTDGGTP